MSTQDQNTPQQKEARPIWARLRTKATAEAVQPQHYTRPQHYSRADMLKQSNIWFRKQGVPLIIPASTCSRCVPTLRAVDPVGWHHAHLLYLPARHSPLRRRGREGFPTELHQSSHKR